MPLAAKIKVCFLVIFQNASFKFIKAILKKQKLLSTFMKKRKLLKS